MSCPRADPSSQTSSVSKRGASASEPSTNLTSFGGLANSVRIDVVVLAVVRNPNRLHLELLRVAVAVAANRDRRTDRDHAGLQARVLRAVRRRQRDVPGLTLVVDDLHRAVRAREIDVRLYLARDFALLLLLARPTVMSGRLNSKEPQSGTGQSDQPMFAHDCLLCCPSRDGTSNRRRGEPSKWGLFLSQLSAAAGVTVGAAGLGLSTSRRLNWCCSKTKLTTACRQTVDTESHQTSSRWKPGCEDS